MKELLTTGEQPADVTAEESAQKESLDSQRAPSSKSTVTSDGRRTEPQEEQPREQRRGTLPANAEALRVWRHVRQKLCGRDSLLAESAAPLSVQELVCSLLSSGSSFFFEVLFLGSIRYDSRLLERKRELYRTIFLQFLIYSSNINTINFCIKM